VADSEPRASSQVYGMRTLDANLNRRLYLILKAIILAFRIDYSESE
jgi:hypothetical protein